MTKFYHIENANRSVGGIVFEPYDVLGGCLMGVFATSVESEIATLDAIAGDPKNGIEEISEAQYEAKHKKKAPNLAEFKHSNKHMAGAIKGPGVSLVEGSESPVQKPEIKSAEDALKVGSVEPARQTQIESIKKKKK